MGRTLNDVVAALPEARRARVEARAQELIDEVESLSELRRMAGKAQVEIASALRVKQPSISKIEKQADMYLSTLRSYVEAIGGKLELVVRLPSRAPVRIEHLGDVAPSVSAGPRKVAVKRQTKPRAAARAG
ncbi:XRE family transcriptional regulator [Roseomonas sp. F4]|uniref:XRE family transcriptional regulator n=2 Tax=Falsiroseomonas TaxID=2870713 RepID=A0ABS6HFS5_9PROT|nr:MULTISPECIES: XRE family transcriptional regulator [Acetobacteraceae]MBU8547176.1 XRE family transcriptional regulator [Roseomonas oleicola]NKE45312.1 XRE family transcriptional regulator [Falsiroseomonas frigidaquae]